MLKPYNDDQSDVPLQRQRAWQILTPISERTDAVAGWGAARWSTKV
jgi:hypothetical protein